MRRFEKERLQRRSSLREYLPRPGSTSGAPVKLIFVALYILGAILVWSKQDEIALSAETTALLSPIASFVMQHIFAVYLIVGGTFLIILILFPLGKKAAQDQLRSIGLVNHTDMVPALKRKYKDMIARQGCAFGIHLILATQRPDANILSGQIKNNVNCRICGRADAILSQIIMDSTAAAEQIPKDARGRFILYDGTVFQAYWFDDTAGITGLNS